MNKYCLLLLVFFVNTGYAAEDVRGQTVGYVYQIDHSNSTAFDINVPGRANVCGSTLYRSYSSSDAIANRKFSLVLAAFMSGKEISFHDTGACEGSRAKITWIRITN
mgnify:CR=1 FL=1